MVKQDVSAEGAQAVFCVCGDAAMAEMAARSVQAVPGFFFAGAFPEYLSGDKRPQFPAAVKQAAGVVAVIDFDQDATAAIETAKRLNQVFSYRVRLVAAGTPTNTAAMLQAIRAGCTEYLEKPLRQEEFHVTLRRFLEQRHAAAPERQAMGKVVTFFGAKGGVGTTTLAVHLALHLTVTHGCKTLLIDHKHQLGHVALYLGLENTTYHFDELLRNAERLDADLMRGFLLRHGSGLDVLASPDYSNEQYDCLPGEIEIVMDVLRRAYDFVIIDSSISYERANFSLIDQADEVCLVSTADVASLRDLARLVEHITRTPSADSKLRLVINRSTADASINAGQIRQAVKAEVKFSIPNNFMELLHSINTGEPVAPTSTSPFSTAIAGWARQMIDVDATEHETPARSPGRAQRLFGRDGGALQWLKQRYS